jgi:IS1 family transposase
VSILLLTYLPELFILDSLKDFMANILNPEKQAVAISMLAEGSSIRSVERTTGIHRDTIMRLGISIGCGCAIVMDAKMHNLNCRALQFDEIWGFVGSKQKNAERTGNYGDVWTFVSIDVDSRMVPSFLVGKRDNYTANQFVEDLACRINGRPQISTDALGAYREAVERGFGANVDYGQVIKVYKDAQLSEQRTYSPPICIRAERRIIAGNPDSRSISTSYVERQNLTMRMHCRRLTRLTNGFSKKFENFQAAVGLHFGYYNFVRVHKSLRMTPAMAGGVTDHIWTVPELIKAAS